MYIQSCIKNLIGFTDEYYRSGRLCYYCINDNVCTFGIQRIVEMPMTIFIHLDPRNLNLSRNWINGKLKLQ